MAESNGCANELRSVTRGAARSTIADACAFSSSRNGVGEGAAMLRHNSTPRTLLPKDRRGYQPRVILSEVAALRSQFRFREHAATKSKNLSVGFYFLAFAAFAASAAFSYFFWK